MIKYFRNAVLAALCIASLGTQARATEFVAVPTTNLVSTSYIHRAGFYTPYGVYVVTCHRWIVGYTYWGAPIWRRVCG
jgi:hypothetical protein